MEEPFRHVDIGAVRLEGVDEKKIIANAEYLAEKFLIEKPRTMRFTTKITMFGVDQVEDTRISSDVDKRRMILQILKKNHEKNPGKYVVRQRLIELTGYSKNELYRNMLYLGEKGLAEVNWALGGHFDARISATGIDVLKEPTPLEHEQRVMSYAYSILYALENRLRIFIEKKLREKYGDQWWAEGASQKIRAKAEGRKAEEPHSVLSLISYTEFGELRRIIMNNWDIFRDTFKSQSGIVGKVDELEPIRNEIAHSRLLSNKQIAKLELFFKEITEMVET